MEFVPETSELSTYQPTELSCKTHQQHSQHLQKLSGLPTTLPTTVFQWHISRHCAVKAVFKFSWNFLPGSPNYIVNSGGSYWEWQIYLSPLHITCSSIHSCLACTYHVWNAACDVFNHIHCHGTLNLLNVYNWLKRFDNHGPSRRLLTWPNLYVRRAPYCMGLYERKIMIVLATQGREVALVTFVKLHWSGRAHVGCSGVWSQQWWGLCCGKRPMLRQYECNDFHVMLSRFPITK